MNTNQRFKKADIVYTLSEIHFVGWCLIPPFLLFII